MANKRNGDQKLPVEPTMPAMSDGMIEPPDNKLTEADVEAAPKQGQEAYHALMEAAQIQADDFRKLGVLAMRQTDAFKDQCRKLIDDLCDPMVVEAMKFQQLTDKTAEHVMDQAKNHAEKAVLFTQWLKEMSDAIRRTVVNGSTKDQEAE